jgi:hypothetical protein
MELDFVTHDLKLFIKLFWKTAFPGLLMIDTDSHTHNGGGLGS